MSHIWSIMSFAGNCLKHSLVHPQPSLNFKFGNSSTLKNGSFSSSASCSSWFSKYLAIWSFTVSSFSCVSSSSACSAASGVSACGGGMVSERPK